MSTKNVLGGIFDVAQRRFFFFVEVATIGAFLVVMQPRLSLATQSINTVVTNTQAQAVPVTVQNYPAVQPVSGTVSVSSLPSISGTVGLLPGTTIDTGDPTALEPFQASNNFSIDDGVGGVQILYDVPIGKRAVITNCSIEASVPSGQAVYLRVFGKVSSVQPNPPASASNTYGYVAPTIIGPDTNNYSFFAGTQSLRMYVEDGQVGFIVQRRAVLNTNPVSGTISFSGYLVDQ